MSVAFDRAMDEIKRVWEASDHFDTKVLQFVGIISAGALAAAAIAAGKIHLHAPHFPPLAIALLIAAIAALVAFVFLAITSAMGVSFSGPLDPRALPDSRHYVEDNLAFEKDMLPFIAEAFDQCLNGQERKWRWFKRSLWALAVAVLCFTGTFTTYVLTPVPKKEVTAVSDDKKDKPTDTPQPSAQDTSKKPVLGPYTITKGQTIPNEPRNGTFHRDTTKKK